MTTPTDIEKLVQEMVVVLAGGKYEVRHTNGTNLRALRYGERWRDVRGDNLVLALVQRIEELEDHQRAQPASVPEGYALVPERMHLDADTLAAIGFVAGGASDDDARAEEPKAWSEAILWVGNIVGDDGKETYGLNVANAEYPEEGSAQLVEFEQPRPAQPASVADLREALRKTAIRWFACAAQATEARKDTKGDSELRAMGRVWQSCAEECEELLAAAPQPPANYVPQRDKLESDHD